MDFSILPLPLLSFFLGILYLITTYTLDGQHKEPQQQQYGGQQWGEQPECQLAAIPIGGHNMHIFTANIPAFHARYRR
jgi:hypothetical protein